MNMHNPPHPGEFIKETYLDPFDVSQNEVAEQLGVAHSTFNRIIRGNSSVSPDMALRFSKVLGRSPESWLAMQAFHDLYIAKKSNKSLNKLKRFTFNDDLGLSTI